MSNFITNLLLIKDQNITMEDKLCSVTIDVRQNIKKEE